MLQSDDCQSKLQAAEDAATSGTVGAAFSLLVEGLEMAAGLSGMPKRTPGRLPPRRVHKAFFDHECVALKLAVCREADLVLQKALERKYHSVVRAKRRAYRLHRLCTILVEEQF